MRIATLLSLVALCVIVLSPTVQAQNRETMIDERYDVGTDGTLEIDVGDADVEVTPSSSNDVHVEVILEARNMERGREYYERQNFDVSRFGNTVRVETNPRRGVRFDWNDWRDHPNILVRVSAPETFNADLRTSDGDITVDRLQGDVRLKTSDGDVDVGTLAGGSIVLSSSDGDIRIDALDGETVDIHTSDGDLDLGEITGDRITARTSDGNIAARHLIGNAEIKTSDGDINLDVVNGPGFFARTSDGDITIDELTTDNGTVRTSDGDITIRHAEGDLNVSGSSAEIRVNVQKAGQVSVSSSDGNITLSIPAGLQADLRLRGDDIRIASGLDFQGRIEGDRADGALNGGGPLIEARTSDGDVTLRRN